LILPSSPNLENRICALGQQSILAGYAGKPPVFLGALVRELDAGEVDLASLAGVEFRLPNMGSAWRGQRALGFDNFKQPAVAFAVSQRPPRAEGVVADFRGDAGGLGPPAHHLPSIGPMQPLAVKLRLPTTVRANLSSASES
jgi:hypothetical protein